MGSARTARRRRAARVLEEALDVEVDERFL
jgi:hypothetical protein